MSSIDIPPPSASLPIPPGPSLSDPPVSEPTPSNPTPSQPPPSSPPPASESNPPPESSPSQPPPETSAPPPPSSDTTLPPVSTPSQPPSNTLSQVVITNSGGGVVTVTSVIPHSPAIPSNSAGANTGNKSFFDNKGALGGVFAVVGLVGLGIVIAFIAWCIRRRRAKQFDDDVAEAAREAAHARPPAFFDDRTDDGAQSYGTQNYVYSDNSHGTYSQPPMDHNRDVYNMSEMNRYAAPVATSGAAGVGVMRARSMRDYDDTPANAGMAGFGAGNMYPNNTYGPGESQSPYPTFGAAYASQPRDAYDNSRYAPPLSQYNNNQYTDALADTGVTPAAVARQPSQHQRNNSNNLARQKSQGARSLVDGYHTPAADSIPSQPESYASRYQPGYRPDPANHPMPTPARTSVYRGDDDDAYGGVSSGTSHSPGEQPYPAQRTSIIDDSDDESEDHGRRVLKVANE